ncbi:MAG: ABC transporter permease [Bacteroidetes bacterium]|nr:ABC transporter permease [Bacteroidota bacterium]
MFRNYFKTAWRNIVRNKISSVVNIAGLALGICAFLLLMEYISLERSVNKFHANLPQMYRLINQDPAGKTWVEVEPGWATIFKQRFPEIKDACRFDEETGTTIISKKDKPNESFSEIHTGYADGSFFSFFSFSVKTGEASSLNKSNVVFISESSAKKYFGETNPLNQTLTVNNQFGKTIYTVEGVYADMKDNSDIQYNMLFSLETLKNPVNLNGNDWAAVDNLNSQYINTYFLLNKNVDISALQKKLTVMRTALKKDKDGIIFKLQPFADVHLGSSLHDTNPTFGNLKYVYMLSGITLLILLIAWFNYINLSTATSFKRANEVGVRKVIGANKRNLVFQFLSESLSLNIIALIVAMILVSLLQPLFNKLVGKNLSLETITTSAIWIYGLILLVAGSIVSGAYTAFFLSAFKPIATLKGKISKTSKGILLRKSLVVSQFAISIVLIIVTIIIYSQLHFMQHKKLGLDPSHLLVIKGPQAGVDSVLKVDRAAFKNELAAESFIKDFCTSGSIPSGNYNFITSGFTQVLSKKGDELKAYSFCEIGAAFLKTYQIQLAAGRNFTEEECRVKWNDNNKILMNEAAIKQIGFANAEDAVNQLIQWDERKLQIIGVVKDYNHTGVQHAVDPIIFYPNSNSNYFTLRLTPENMEAKIDQLKKLYVSNFSGNPFEYFFIDDNFNKLYASERQYGNIFTSASVWAIMIACLGLFGLVTFTVESRTKEIGLRKVLGASVVSIVSLLSKDFLVLVFVAFIIATPVAWYFMNQWLDDFAYRISIGWQVFVIAGIAAMLLALITISFQAIKAAIANPVKSLRTE